MQVKLKHFQSGKIVETDLMSYSEFDKREWEIVDSEKKIKELTSKPTLVKIYSEEGEEFLVTANFLNSCYISVTGHFILPKKSFLYMKAQLKGLNIFSTKKVVKLNN